MLISPDARQSCSKQQQQQQKQRGALKTKNKFIHSSNYMLFKMT